MTYEHRNLPVGRGRDPWGWDGSRRPVRRTRAVEIGTVPYDDRPDPWRYWAVIRRQGRFALAVFLLVVAAVIAGTLLQEPIYRASGLMEIRRASSDVVPVDALFRGESPSSDYLETQQGLMRSFALAARVVQDERLDRVPEFAENDAGVDTEGGGIGELSVAELQPIVDRFQERFSISPGAGGRLVRVQFDSRDPGLASDVVNSILDNFVAMRVDGGEEATEWLAAQLEEARLELEQAESDLQAYARENGLPLARGEEDIAANVQERLDALEADLIAARAERLAAEARQRTLVEGGRSEAMDNSVVEDLTLRISELQREHARLSSTFTDGYPEVQRLAREIASLQARRTEASQRLARGVTGEYESALERERLLEDAVQAEQLRSDSLMTSTAGYRIVAREVEANRERYGALQEKLMEAEVATAVSGVDVDIVDRAMPPVEPYSPSWPLSIAFAMIGGAVLAIGAAFAREFLDPRVRSASEIGATVDAPVLAVIPTADRPDGETENARLASTRPSGRLADGARRRDARGRWMRIGGDGRSALSRSRAIADAMGSLRAAVLFEQGPAAARSILVTSSIPGEGKTTVAVNFAISLAGMGRDVLLVDADMRRPCVHRVLETGSGPGLADVLDGSEDEWPALVRRDQRPGLDVLVAGREPRSPEVLLASPRFTMLLDEAQELYDFVVVDGPALFIDADDARIMADRVDGVVAVVRSRSTPRNVLRPVLSAVPNLLGVILNDLDPDEVPEDFFARRDDEDGESEEALAGADGVARNGDSGSG